MSHPVVLIADDLGPTAAEALGSDLEVRYCQGTNRTELLAAIADVDAVLVRSSTKIDAEAIATARRLRVVARAGVGVDNIDLRAAREAGVMVVNAPTSNATSVAEFTVALILGTARHIAPANAALRSGTWARSSFMGTELAGKTVGILGLGRIGSLVARQLRSFGVRLIATDPHVSQATAARLGVQLLPLHELLRQSDFITIHVPKTPETVGLIGEEALSKVKPTARIINVARGDVVDEVALATAIKEGRVAGAAIDVFASEPVTSSPLFELDSVVVTPHLGASTVEAQEKAAIAVATSVRLALAGEPVPDAVNLEHGGVVRGLRSGPSRAGSRPDTYGKRSTVLPAAI